MTMLKPKFAASKLVVFILALCFAVGAVAGTASSARAELIHRYSFKDGKADDSVGEINGKLEGGAKIVDGKLELKNLAKTSGDADLAYLSFSERPLPKTGSATIEVWFTSKCDGQFARVFDFGRRGQGYLFLTVDEGNDVPRAAITTADWGEEAQIHADDAVNDGKLHLATLVIDAKASKLQLFIDGKQTGTSEPLGENSLEKIKGTSFWLGRSLYDTDAGFTGTINEFRIFDSALTPDEIKLHFKAGPAEIDLPKK